jgi:hypothetical protein
MKIKYFLLSIILIFICFLPKTTFAHVLESENAFGGVMHINPNDEPVVGSQSTIIFDIKSKDEDFKLSDCVCNIHIIKDKKEVALLPLQIPDPKSPNTGTVIYTFASPGDYSLKMTGKPHPDEEETFTLTYPTHVTALKEVATTPQSRNSYLKYIGAVVLLVLLFVIIRKKIIH